MEGRSRVGFSLLKIASLYMMAALILGLVLGVSHSFALLSVHSHIGLLGWLTMAVTGVSSTLVVVALLIFTLNLFVNCRHKECAGLEIVH